MLSGDRVDRTFILRLRREPREISGSRVEWRGEVEAVPGGEKRHFLGLEGICAAVTELLAGQDTR